MGEFLMPSLGADMDRGTLVEWMVKPGDTVAKGDVVAVVDTTKAAIEVETFESGVVTALLVEPGTEVPVGTPLAVIGGAGAPVAAAPVVAAPVVAPPVAAPVVAARPPHPPRVSSPLARRRAAELGVDLATVHGTGPGGAITESDVRAAAAHPAAATTAATTAAVRQDAVAALMARSKREVPHYYLATTIDLARATAWLREHNASVAVTERVVPAALLLKAAALAAREVPGLNGWWRDGRYQPATAVDLGVAVALRDGGLVAPVIERADELDVAALMSALRDIVQRARAGRLRASTMREPSITVTNLGEQGAEAVYGVIYPPQVALVGYGRVVERPVAVDGMVGVHPVVRATLAADHRVSNGHSGGAFLAAVDRHLQYPEEL